MNARQIDIQETADKIRLMRKTAEELQRMGEAIPFPSLARNAARILASLKMLEINVSEALDLDRS